MGKPQAGGGKQMLGLGSVGVGIERLGSGNGWLREGSGKLGCESVVPGVADDSPVGVGELLEDADGLTVREEVMVKEGCSKDGDGDTSGGGRGGDVSDATRATMITTASRAIT